MAVTGGVFPCCKLTTLKVQGLCPTQSTKVTEIVLNQRTLFFFSDFLVSVLRPMGPPMMMPPMGPGGPMVPRPPTVTNGPAKK